MKVTIELEDEDFNPLHDIILDLHGKVPTRPYLISVWEGLPQDIKDDAVRWGIDDSVVRDSIYVYLKNKK